MMIKDMYGVILREKSMIKYQRLLEVIISFVAVSLNSSTDHVVINGKLLKYEKKH